MEIGWLALFSAALSGGVLVKLLEFLAEWIKSKHQSSRSAREIVDMHLDPLLKAADEIAGKTRALAERDFNKLVQAAHSGTPGSLSPEIVGLLYLYAQFWSRIEILKQASLGVSISNDKRGATLKEFLACLESQRIRLVDRVHQKAIGEITTHITNDGKLRSIGLVEFADKLSTNSGTQQWIAPLVVVLQNLRIKAYRQKVLVYGVVVYALIDTLDPENHTTSNRPAYPNKLSKQARRDIKRRVFGVYLKKVGNIEKYVGMI